MSILGSSMGFHARARHSWLGRTALAIGLATIVSAAPAIAQDGAEPPSVELRQRIEKELAEYYGTAWQPGDPAKRRTAAAQFLRDARRADSEAERYVLLQKAVAMAESSGEARVALRALRELEDQWQLPEGHQSRADIVRSALATARDPEEFAGVVRSGLGAVDLLMSRGDYREANSLASALRSGAVRARDRELIAAASEKQRETRQALAVYRRVEPSLEKLEESPDDPEANLEVGRFYAFQLGHWEQALPHLAKGGDEGLAALAKADLAEPEKATAQKELGDRYWKLAEQRSGDEAQALRKRARHWYRQSLDRLSGNERELILRRAASPDAIHWAGRVYNPGLKVTYKLGDKTHTRTADEFVFDWRSKPPVPGFGLDDRFNVSIEGYLRAPAEGWYVFDLGTRFHTTVRINDRVAYDGRFQAEFSRWLYKGLNPIEIEHRAHPRETQRTLSLRWVAPGQSGPQTIASGRLYHLLGDAK